MKTLTPRLAPLVCWLLVLACSTPVFSAEVPDMVRAHEAGDYVGELVMVCGVVASARHAQSSRGGPTYLNFDKAYPEHVFTVLIWGRDRREFDIAPERLEGYKACAYGKVELYRGKPQMTIRQREQLRYAKP